MNQVKLVISNILLEERKKRVEEAFLELDDIRDEKHLIERYVIITSNLVNEGYEIDEIDVPDPVKKLLPGSVSSSDIKGALTDAAATSAKEYIIRFILTQVFGANATFSTYASQLFADWNPLDLLKIFKNREECTKSFPNLSDRLLTMLVRYIGSNEVGGNQNDYGINFKALGSTYLGNLFGEVIKESDVSEKISNKFCEFIH
jgi:hypothetical protein